MAALTAGRQIVWETGDYDEPRVKAATTIFAGAFVGDDASGYARPLVAADPFWGIAQKDVVNSGAAGAKRVRVRRGRFRIRHAVVGATAVTDKDNLVYASDDNTLTLTSTSNTLVGKVVAWHAGTDCTVELATADAA